MAEIKIEKKKPMWPWILLIFLLIAAAIYYFMYYDQDDTSDDVDDVTTESIDDVPSQDYDEIDNTITYADSLKSQDFKTVMSDYNLAIKDSSGLGNEIAYIKNTLTQLFKAVEMKANQYGESNSQAFMDLRTEVQTMDASTMAGSLKSTAQKIVAVLESIQTKQFPALNADITQLKNRVNEIHINVSLDKQKTRFSKFFEKAAYILNNMNP